MTPGAGAPARAIQATGRACQPRGKGPSGCALRSSTEGNGSSHPRCTLSTNHRHPAGVISGNRTARVWTRAWTASWWVRRYEPTSLWLVQPDGDGPRWFGLGPDSWIEDVQWSPTSKKLAVAFSDTSLPSPQPEHVDPIDPTGLPTIRIDGVSQPRWSPDGRYLAATDAHELDATEARDLVLMNADGSGRHAFPMPLGTEPFTWVR